MLVYKHMLRNVRKLRQIDPAAEARFSAAWAVPGTASPAAGSAGNATDTLKSAVRRSASWTSSHKIERGMTGAFASMHRLQTIVNASEAAHKSAGRGGAPDAKSRSAGAATAATSDAGPSLPARWGAKDHPQFHVGMVIQHRLYGYRAVIFGHTPRCEATARWQNEMGVHSLPSGANQPFYHALCDLGNGAGANITYIAEENVRPVTTPMLPVQHPLIAELFDEFVPGKCGGYVPSRKLQERYPLDSFVLGTQQAQAMLEAGDRELSHALQAQHRTWSGVQSSEPPASPGADGGSGAGSGAPGRGPGSSSPSYRQGISAAATPGAPLHPVCEGMAGFVKHEAVGPLEVPASLGGLQASSWADRSALMR